MKTKIFKINESKENVICPPEQIFQIESLEFLLTLGGHLAENNNQYENFVRLLEQIGEKDFTIRENIGATVTERTIPFEAAFSINSNLFDFDKKMQEFDENFGMMPWHFFVYGRLDSWGIYISEFPSMNIIGCKPEFVERFRAVFNIIGNGYLELEKFLEQEFSYSNDPNFRSKFLNNYDLIF
jgi:hypothetical protein